MPYFEHFGLSNILPGDCHVASLLAMTVVVVTRLCRFKLSDKLKFESFRMENPRLANANRGIVLQRAV